MNMWTNDSDRVTLPDDMDWLKIPALDDSETDVEELRKISVLIDGFIESNPQLREYIADFPENEGYDASAKDGALFTIVRSFLIWLHKKPEHNDYNLPRILPTKDIHG